MLNSADWAEHGIFSAKKMKMPAMFGIFIYINREIFLLSYV